MYRVVLVDDERLIVRGLSSVVPWAELGCEVCGTAYDGNSGLELGAGKASSGRPSRCSIA